LDDELANKFFSLQTARYGWDIQTVPPVRTAPFCEGGSMLRDATHEPLINRTVLLQLDDEGVLHLDEEILAGLCEGDALGIPGPPPTCETCWAEAAVAISLGPAQMTTFKGAACASDHRQADGWLVPILSFWRPVRSCEQWREQEGE
jgi:hypothetical protein